MQAQLAEAHRELTTTLEALGDDAAAVEAQIDRGGWKASTGAQLHTLREALIIALGKSVVYLRPLGRDVPLQVRQWVG